MYFAILLDRASAGVPLNCLLIPDLQWTKHMPDAL